MKERIENTEEGSIILSSSKSLIVSLEAVKNGRAGLDAHRQAILNRISNTGDWARFELNSIEMKDLAYLTAKVGDEFALLRGKKEDILFHGERMKCTFTGELEQLLRAHQLEIVGHSHPAEEIPIPSKSDRETLREIGQAKSTVISAMTGRMVSFGPDLFETQI